MFQLEESLAVDESWFDAPMTVGDAAPSESGVLSYGADEASEKSASCSFRRRSAGAAVAEAKSSTSPTTTTAAAAAVSTSAKAAGKRSKGKFPGPAGRLPRLSADGGDNFDAAMQQLLEAESAKRAAAAYGDADSTATASQSSQFNEESWSSALADIGGPLLPYFQKYSVGNTIELARRGELPHNKVPVMLLMVDSVDANNLDCVACLKDPSGRLQATIHQQVMREFKDRVLPGAVIVLRRATVFSPDWKSYYLNVTLDNVVQVYDAEASRPIAGGFSLTDEDLRRLEAECLSPPVLSAACEQLPPTPSAPTPRRGGGGRGAGRQSAPAAVGPRLSGVKRPSASLAAAAAASSSVASVAFGERSRSSSCNSPASVDSSGSGVKKFRFGRHQQHQQHQHQQLQSSKPPQAAVAASSSSTAFHGLLDDDMDDLLSSALDDL